MSALIEHFGAKRRATLASLADVLVPAAEGMPAASEVGVAATWLDRVLESRPDLADALTRVVDAAEGTDDLQLIRKLERDDRACFDALLVAVAGAYYMTPAVRRLLGYPGQQALPLEEAVPSQSELEVLLEPVLERGRIFRETNGDEWR